MLISKLCCWKFGPSLVLCVLGLSLASSPALPAATERVSVGTAGEEANGDSRHAAMTPDARYVAFVSYATNLTPDAPGPAPAVYLRDRVQATTSLVSVALAGQTADGWSDCPAVSADGRFVAFVSWATNLVGTDTNGYQDIFLRDLVAGTTELISVSNSGDQANATCDHPAISADGRCVFFDSYAANLVAGLPQETSRAVYLRDRVAGTTELVSLNHAGEPIDGAATYPAITPDARYVLFAAEGNDIAPGYTSYRQLFLRDRTSSSTELVSVGTTGEQADSSSWYGSLSADARFIAFRSNASNLVAGDTNAAWDIFVRDRVTGETQRVSVSSDGEQADGASGSSSWPPAISADGRFIAFISNASNLVPWDDNTGPDAFLHDRLAGQTQLISVGLSPGHTEGASGWFPAISADGRCVAFGSDRPDLVADDTNHLDGVFLRDRLTFPDVPLDHWAFYQVGACSMEGVVRGYPDGLYRPSIAVARDQMAVFISRAVAGGEAYIPTGPAQPSFDDVPTDHWAYDHIEYAVASNVVEGYGNRTYHPEWDVTRGQTAVFVARAIVTPTGEVGMEPYDPPDTATFPDVPAGLWCYNHVEYIVQQGIASGYQDGKYHPEYTCSRDQMAVFITRAFELPM